MNLWALPKTTELRLLMLTLEQRVDIGRLSLDSAADWNHQELYLHDASVVDLSAYLYTYGQTEGRYGLQLHYPTQLSGTSSPYNPMENLSLDKTAELICLHFELT
jgi:hypothetical protein